MRSIKILAVLAALLFGAAAAPAQTVERTDDYPSFNAVNITDGSFDVTLVKSRKYSIKLVTDAVITDYVHSTVRDNTVYISYDEKNVPKEVKKLFKGRRTPDPVLQVIIYAPTLQQLGLCDKCVFSCTAEEFSTDRLDITLQDNARVHSFSVRAENIGINLRKKASVTMTVNVTGSLTLQTDGSSSASLTGRLGALTASSDGSSAIVLEGESEEIDLRSEGSSQLSVSTDTRKVRIQAANSSKVNVKGSASEDVEIAGKNNAVVDVRELRTKSLDLQINSATVQAGEKRHLKVDLNSGAAVYYDGEPHFEVVRIVKSTLAPTGTK